MMQTRHIADDIFKTR